MIANKNWTVVDSPILRKTACSFSQE